MEIRNTAVKSASPVECTKHSIITSLIYAVFFVLVMVIISLLDYLLFIIFDWATAKVLCELVPWAIFIGPLLCVLFVSLNKSQRQEVCTFLRLLFVTIIVPFVVLLGIFFIYNKKATLEMCGGWFNKPYNTYVEQGCATAAQNSVSLEKLSTKDVFGK